uniref:Uncharacterized protein B-137 n=1 Tax=Human adenovirus C serotype 2 TaxID=10515 RepID=Y137_ADE02|nr:RecName: Full=Uncharacterized protein B-137 [Human adenovirus 2]
MISVDVPGHPGDAGGGGGGARKVADAVPDVAQRQKVLHGRDALAGEACAVVDALDRAKGEPVSGHSSVVWWINSQGYHGGRPGFEPRIRPSAVIHAVTARVSNPGVRRQTTGERSFWLPSRRGGCCASFFGHWPRAA